MSKIPCDVIKDLLPSYIDKLTSETTNREIEAHMLECEQCQKVLEQMKAPDMETSEEDIKELDFLKKTNRNYRKNILICVAIVWVVSVIFFGMKNYMVGQYVNAEYLTYGLDVSDTEMSITVSTTSGQGIQHIDINESDGILEISVRCVPKSFLYKSTASETFFSHEKIRQIRIDDRIIWANGETISPLTSSLYANYNPYIGNMPANGKLVTALNMTAYTGNFTNELQTSEEPYSWKIIFSDSFSSDEQAALEERLKNYACIYLAEIGNLGEVIYEYNMDGETQILSVTSNAASEIAGTDIKKVGTDINLLEHFIRKTGLSNIALGSPAVKSSAHNENSFTDYFLSCSSVIFPPVTCLPAKIPG